NTPPAITDKLAQQYGGDMNAKFRYTGVQTITVYSSDVDKVRKVMSSLSSLGKEGIVFIGDNYQAQVEYLFNQLNEVKPAMIEEATNKAREVALKFASDSNSRLGKIKQASQGQFSITDRDKNNPHIKLVRVVSTVEYYLAD
ncbi:SIMPL domain-containing protein, partial [Paraglaciecola hydrolytica]|uniref:SIMPL domain-containing protein n=1 Tax=Paraglaciecola hydrolytica TaxID=1799789 RepID=UPI000AEBE472